MNALKTTSVQTLLDYRTVRTGTGLVVRYFKLLVVIGVDRSSASLVVIPL